MASYLSDQAQAHVRELRRADADWVKQIPTVLERLWWVMTSALVVGYGLSLVESTIVKTAGLVFILIGLGLVAIVAALFVATGLVVFSRWVSRPS